MAVKIALVGNPNCGKTTMFNNLTGANQYVGNWPGVTVEKKEGRLKGYSDVIVTDLPGIYSLSPYTLEEVVSRNYIINEHPDVILNLVDGSNIERNLYLTTQLLEMGVSVVIALNMIDIVRKNGDKIDTEALGKKLGCPVVETSALSGLGLKEAAAKAVEMAKAKMLSANPCILTLMLKKRWKKLNTLWAVRCRKLVQDGRLLNCLSATARYGLNIICRMLFKSSLKKLLPALKKSLMTTAKASLPTPAMITLPA